MEQKRQLSAPTFTGALSMRLGPRNPLIGVDGDAGEAVSPELSPPFAQGSSAREASLRNLAVSTHQPNTKTVLNLEDSLFGSTRSFETDDPYRRYRRQGSSTSKSTNSTAEMSSTASRVLALRFRHRVR
jgi:hypothetical protein